MQPNQSKVTFAQVLPLGARGAKEENVLLLAVLPWQKRGKFSVCSKQNFSPHCLRSKSEAISCAEKKLISLSPSPSLHMQEQSLRKGGNGASGGGGGGGCFSQGQGRRRRRRRRQQSSDATSEVRKQFSTASSSSSRWRYYKKLQAVSSPQLEIVQFYCWGKYVFIFTFLQIW